MRERDLRRVQEHALEAELAQRLVQLEVAVLVVAENGMAKVREVYADLVRAAGEELGFEEAPLGAALDQAKDRFRLLPRAGNRNPALAFARHAALEGKAHALQGIAEAPGNAHEVALVDRAIAQH